MDTFRRKALGPLVAGMLGGVAGAAGAAPFAVTFADLDLGSRAGVATLYARLEAAAQAACAAHVASSSHAQIAACIDYAIRRAVSEIGAPRLIGLYETRSGHVLLPDRRRGTRAQALPVRVVTAPRESPAS